jgi:hypothetical protein
MELDCMFEILMSKHGKLVLQTPKSLFWCIAPMMWQNLQELLLNGYLN